MKRMMTLLIALLMLALMLPAMAETKVPVIGILQYVQHPALDAAREGFIKGLADEGFVEGENIKLDIQNANADQSTASTIADHFIGQDTDLVLAIATPAAQALANKTSTMPILATAVTDFIAAGLVKSYDAPGFNVSGTTDMNPVEAQVRLVKRLVPEAKTLGLLYTSSEINSKIQADLAKAEAELLGLEVIEVTVNNTNDVQQAAISILEQVDALYVPTDNIIAASMPLVAEEAVTRKVPIIVGEENQVLSGGTATEGLSYFKLGVQTGHMAAKLLRGEAKIGEMPIETQSEFETLINKTFMDAVGLTIPDDLLPFAKDIVVE